MATQKEKGHGSDTPPKLQQLPGRSSNKLQGRLYSNAGRGYDREALQKMSAKAGPALVEPRTQPDGSVAKDSDDSQNNDVATSGLDTHHAAQRQKSSYSTQHYLLGAILFLAGIVVGNVVIPALTTTTTDKVAATEPPPADVVSTPANDGIDSITTITPNAATPTSSAAGCSVDSLNNTIDESKGCSIEALSTTDNKKESL